jgi:glycosyltransferase involved in cell wall biosynthesis
VRHGNSLVRRCQGIDGLDIREVDPNLVAAGRAIRGSKLAHAHEARTVYAGLFANLLFGVPYLFTRRVVAPQSKSPLRSLAYHRAARVAAVSGAVVDEMRKCHPHLEAVVVPDAMADFEVDPANVTAIRANYPGKTLIGHVGALDHSHKGQLTIIEVAREALKSRPDWHFLLCGDGQDKERFLLETADLPNIDLVGWVENVGDYLAAFDLFVYPSLHEALGSTLLDAMQFGLPVVASNVGGIPEFVECGVNGRLVEPEDAAALRESIAEILDSDQEAASMRTANAEKAFRYSASAMADAYETLYREITDQV